MESAVDARWISSSFSFTKREERKEREDEKIHHEPWRLPPAWKVRPQMREPTVGPNFHESWWEEDNEDENWHTLLQEGNWRRVSWLLLFYLLRARAEFFFHKEKERRNAALIIKEGTPLAPNTHAQERNIGMACVAARVFPSWWSTVEPERSSCLFLQWRKEKGR